MSPGIEEWCIFVVGVQDTVVPLLRQRKIYLAVMLLPLRKTHPCGGENLFRRETDGPQEQKSPTDVTWHRGSHDTFLHTSTNSLSKLGLTLGSLSVC